MRVALVLPLALLGCVKPSSSSPTTPTVAAPEPSTRAASNARDGTPNRVADIRRRFEDGGELWWLENVDDVEQCERWVIEARDPHRRDARLFVERTEQIPGLESDAPCTRRWRVVYTHTVARELGSPDEQIVILGPTAEIVSESDSCLKATGVGEACGETLPLEAGPHDSILAGGYWWFLDQASCEAGKQTLTPSHHGC